MSDRKPRKLAWSKRADADLAGIDAYYLEHAGERIAEEAVDAVYWQARLIAETGLIYRAGKRNTRECVMKKWPYTIVYRIEPRAVTVVRVLHQRRAYFNPPA